MNLNYRNMLLKETQAVNRFSALQSQNRVCHKDTVTGTVKTSVNTTVQSRVWKPDYEYNYNRKDNIESNTGTT